MSLAPETEEEVEALIAKMKAESKPLGCSKEEAADIVKHTVLSAKHIQAMWDSASNHLKSLSEAHTQKTERS